MDEPAPPETRAPRRRSAAGTRPDAEQALSRRARELDAIQVLAHAAAAATTPGELFSGVAARLLEVEPLDLVGFVHRLDAVPALTAFTARPFTTAFVGGLERHAARLLDPAAEAIPSRLAESAAFETAALPRDDFDEGRLVVLPLCRRDLPVAWLLAVPAAGAGDAELRLLYPASNQVSMHLDRLLTAGEAEADRFRAILESMPQAVILTDDRLGVVQVNAAAGALLRQAALAERDPLDWLGLAGEARRVLELGCGTTVDELPVEPDRVFTATLSLLERGARGLVLVLTDVTESRQMQQRLAHSEKMSSLGQMISGVAHELNNPLATILGYSQLMVGSVTDEKLGRRLQVLNEEAQRCRHIVANLLSFARRREPECRPLSLNEVARSVLALLRYQLRVESVALEAQLDGDLCPVLGDAHQLRQALVNLVTNARHAVRSGGDSGTVRISTGPGVGGGAVMIVEDSGPGVPAEIRSKIFDPFFTTKPEGQGTGLGLALVYGIVTGHGGSIALTSSALGGAAFRMVFPPAGPAAAAREAVVERRSPAGTARPGRILVVDDEPSFARIVCEALVEDGHRVEAAADGHEALDLLKRETFDLVVSDLKMPGMDGERLHAEMERLCPGLGRRLLLTTGDSLGEAPDAFVARTGVEVLHKPFALDRLCDRVRARLAAEPRPPTATAP